MLQVGSFVSWDKVRVEVASKRPARWLVASLYALSGLTFLLDLLRNDTLAYGILYAPLVATAVFHKSRTSLWVLSGVASLMVVIGAFFPVVNSDLPDMIGNRILSILAIAATALFVHYARDIQERLAAETRRAEAAEKMKTDMLNDLSAEIRTPLHGLLGVLTLTMATCRPEQREVLGRVRADGQELLATIDTLLELSQMEGRTLEHQTVDIANIARDAAEGARAAAGQRQIKIALAGDRETEKASAIGDPLAMRRILDNLLATAVRTTPPGGTVSVSVARTASTVTASVSEAGKGLPPELTTPFDHEVTDFEAGWAGLALSTCLARAMKGTLTARTRPNSGATLSVSLPAA